EDPRCRRRRRGGGRALRRGRAVEPARRRVDRAGHCRYRRPRPHRHRHRARTGEERAGVTGAGEVVGEDGEHDPGARHWSPHNIMRGRKMRIVVVVVIAALLAGGALVVALRSGAPAREPQSPSAISGTPPTSSTPAASRPTRGGRIIDVDVAFKELELIRPVKIKSAGDFTLPMADGTTFRLSDHRGKMVFVNFWATWCEPCKEEIPAMERLWRRHKDEGFVMVGVSLDSNPKVVPPFLAQHKV